MKAANWTPQMDNALTDLRRAGKSWDAIGREFDVSRNAIINRAKRIECPREPLSRAGYVASAHLFVMTDREPMPPGHAASWGAITRGTSLEGIAYHYETPLRRQRDAN